MNITKEEFEAYEKVRASGKTNMFNVSFVCSLSGLERGKVFTIMKNYSELKNKFQEVKNATDNRS